MTFEEYIRVHCESFGKKYWNAWVESNYYPEIVLEYDSPPISLSKYTLVEIDRWSRENCRGGVHILSRAALFQFEEDSALFVLRWY